MFEAVFHFQTERPDPTWVDCRLATLPDVGESLRITTAGRLVKETWTITERWWDLPETPPDPKCQYPIPHFLLERD